MTFVVGQITPRGPQLAADTLLTFADSRTSNLFTGALKLVILDAATVVGYAGRLDRALGAVRAIFQLRSDAERLQALAHATRTGDVQFLLASARRDSIARIEKGAWESRRDVWAWIGDRDALGRFQRAHAASEVHALDFTPADLVAQCRLVVAIREAVADGPPSVGGSVIAVTLTDAGFVYCPWLEAHAGGHQEIPSGRWTTLAWGQGADAGSFTETLLTPREPGIGAVAIHLREIDSGALYWPTRFDDNRVYRNVDVPGFAQAVMRDTGLSLVPGAILT